jgi:hypothetical protein
VRLGLRCDGPIRKEPRTYDRASSPPAGENSPLLAPIDSQLPTRPGCFRSSSRPTMPSPARRAAPGWGLPYQSASLRCTAAKSGSSRSPAKARPFPSRSRSSSSGRWRRHEQAHSGGRGPGRQSADHSRYAVRLIQYPRIRHDYVRSPSPHAERIAIVALLVTGTGGLSKAFSSARSG